MEMTPKLYSPFLPLLLLLIFLAGGVGYQFYLENQERLAVEARIQELLPQANAALDAKKKLTTLAVEVDKLAARDQAAAQIVTDFNIHVQNGPQVDSGGSNK